MQSFVPIATALLFVKETAENRQALCPCTRSEFTRKKMFMEK